MLTIYVNKSIEMGSSMFSLKKISYIVYFIAIVSIFVLLYYGGYYYAINNMKSDNLITKDEAQISNPGVKTDDYTEVNNSESNVILSSARYIIEEYNSDTDELTKKEEKIPVDYIGLTREQVIDYLTTYVARHSFASVLKKSGVNIALISEALGHSDLTTTQIYLDSFDNEQIDNAMKNLL